MLESPQILQITAKPTAVIRFTIPDKDCPKIFGSAVAEIMIAIAEQGIQPTGAFFSHHLKMPSQIFDFEVGVPVASPIKETDRVKASQLPATSVARALYRGPYEELGTAWNEFNSWIAENNLVAGDTLWECYEAGPESSNDSKKWITQFNRPLIS